MDDENNRKTEITFAQRLKQIMQTWDNLDLLKGRECALCFSIFNGGLDEVCS